MTRPLFLFDKGTIATLTRQNVMRYPAISEYALSLP